MVSRLPLTHHRNAPATPSNHATVHPTIQPNPCAPALPPPAPRRSLLTQEGICLTLDPAFHFLEVAYPYIARRLLTDEDPALRSRLFQVRGAGAGAEGRGLGLGQRAEVWGQGRGLWLGQRAGAGARKAVVLGRKEGRLQTIDRPPVALRLLFLSVS